MNELAIVGIFVLPIVILTATYFDAKRDAATGKDKWPNSGFRIMRRGLRLKRAKTKDDSARAEIEGYRLFYTIDPWHVWKWVSFYPPLASLWVLFVASFWYVGGYQVAIFTGLVLVVLAYYVWQYPDKPWNQ